MLGTTVEREEEAESGDESGSPTLPETVNGWRLTESTRRADHPYGNYEDPTRQRVYVNVMPVDRTKSPLRYRAKYNDHSGMTEPITISTDLVEVIKAAVAWMRENPAGETDGNGGRQQMLF